MPQIGTAVVTDHAILVAGLPLFNEAEADGTIYPGMVVELTAAGHIQAADAKGDNILGVADLAMAYQTGRGSRRKALCDPNTPDADDNPYLIGDQVKVISGPIIVMLILQGDQDVDPGDKVQAGTTDGMVEEYSCTITGNPCALVGEVLVGAFTAGGECEYIMVKLLV